MNFVTKKESRMSTTKKRRSRMGNERGVALVVAVLVMITATFMGIAAVMTSDIEVRISGNQRVSEGAFYAADAGIDNGLAFSLPATAASTASSTSRPRRFPLPDGS
jgi:Tfp pilus assembly protein PilX